MAICGLRSHWLLIVAMEILSYVAGAQPSPFDYRNSSAEKLVLQVLMMTNEIDG